MDEVANINPPMIKEIALLERLKDLTRRYEENLKKREVDVGFNLFAIISDHYHRENLHSDVLKAFLDRHEKHEAGNAYLQLFLEFIISRGAKVKKEDYPNPEVVREEGRIDILIKDRTTNKAIIVENKIYNAVDQHQQLPRYLESVTRQNYACDAIVYFKLDQEADPDKSTWTDEQRKEVIPKLVSICAYDGTDDGEGDLLKGWILKCHNASTPNSQAQHILKQYGDIIKKLGATIMNKPEMETFFRIISQHDNLKTVQSLTKMLVELPWYGAELIVAKFASDHEPFDKPFRHYDGALFENARFGDARFATWIWVGSDNKYLLQFFDRRDPEGTNGEAKRMLRTMGCLEHYKFEGDKFCLRFDFPAGEEELFKHIRAFKEKLGQQLASEEAIG
jgi:hypothetical protein